MKALIKRRRFHGRLRAVTGWVIVLMMLWRTGSVWGEERQGFAAYKRGRLAHLEADLSRIVGAHPKDPAMEAYLRRLELTDKAAQLVLARLEALDLSSLDEVLAEVAPGGRTTRQKAPFKVTASGLTIVAEFADRFAEPLDRPPVSEKEMAVLRAYYDTALKAAASYVAERGWLAQALNKKAAPKTVELSLVMPFLHIPDEKWAPEQIRLLPEWMRKPANLGAAEDVALRAQRPYTAYQIALYRRGQVEAAPSQKLTVPSYMAEAAKTLVKAREYRAAISCIMAGIREATGRESHEEAAGLHLQLAGLYDSIGHTALAADEAKKVLEAFPDSPHRGKVAVFRLKCLYRSGGLEQITKEATQYRADKRCATYMPQIMYISWVAYRRLDRPEKASELQKAFLARFRRHPLAADMYFASAMTSLAAGNYREALRLLEVVEYRYPKSRLIGKVKQVRSKLEGLSEVKGL